MFFIQHEAHRFEVPTPEICFHLSFFSKKNLTMFLNYEKLLSILEKCVFESALTFYFGKVCDAKLCY